MPMRIGLVHETVAGQMAQVITDRKGGCGGCQPSHGCRSCLASSKILSQVQNPISAQNGDLVEISMAQRALWCSAALFYLLPVLSMVIGAIVGNEAIGGTWATVGLALGGLTASFLLVWWIYRVPRIQLALVPRITKIIQAASPVDKSKAGI